MRKELKFIFLLFLLSILSVNVYGAKRYWVAANDSIWNSTRNWSATSGGAFGASVPGSNDTAYFNGGSVKKDTFDINVSVKRLEISSAYTGKIIQGTKTLTIGTSGAVLSGGTFSGGSASITVSGAFTISGIAFTSTSGTFSSSANFTFSSGSFAHNNGKMKFTASNTITGSTSLYQLEFAPAATSAYSIASGTTLTVNNTLTFSGSNTIDLNTGTINAKGDISITNSAFGTSGGTATININGTATQTMTGTTTNGWGKLPNVTINKSSDTLKLVNFISIGGTWTYTAGIINAGTSTVHFANTLTIIGSHTLYNITFTASSARTYTISSGTTVTANGTVSISGTANITINTGTINAKGNITSSNTATGGGGNATIVINGTSNQTFTGSGTAGQGHFPKITIDKGPSDGTLTLASVITADGDWIYTKGIVSSGTSTVVLYGTGNLDGQESGSSEMMSFYSLAFATNTRTLTGNLDVNNNLTIGNGATLSAGSNSIYCGGRWGNTGGTWTYGTSTVIFDGNTYKQIVRTSGGVPATETFYNLSFNRSGASQTLANIVTVNNVLTLTKGHVKTTSTNYLLLIDGATVSGGSDSAYVHGPVRKTGDDAFVFPLGDTTLADTAYHPLGISAPGVNTDQFEATYFALAQIYGDSLVDTLNSISTCEYWILDRKLGSSTPIVSVGWNKNSCNVDNYEDLRLAQWNGIKWLDLGAASITVSDHKGGVNALTPISFGLNPVPIVIGNKKSPEPYAILLPEINGGYHIVYNGKLLFKFDETYNESGKLYYNIYDDYSRLVASSSFVSATALHPATVQQGDNRYLLNLLDCTITLNGNLGNGFYLLEVINDKNEKRYLLLKHIKTIQTECANDVLPN
ncbi:MAG: hypothetical protein ABIS12_09655 [Bacteroidia bacterium]